MGVFILQCRSWQWNHLDGVDGAEKTRNDAIQGYQGNRNPFVDDAALADRIADF